jgi:hypothetical protein
VTTVTVEFDEDGFDSIDDTASRSVASITDDVASDMRRFVPVLTAALQGTITPRTYGLIGRVYFGNPAFGIDYHLHQEYGTYKMQAQPYARPALYRQRSL